MLRFASHPLADGETAVLYVEGEDVLIILNSRERDPQRRCAALNRLLERLSVRLSVAA